MEPREYLIAFVAGVPSLLIGLLPYLRSLKVDSMAAQAGMMSESRAGTAQVINALNQLVDQLQEENLTFREEVKYLLGRIEYLNVRLDKRDQECARLRQRLKALKAEKKGGQGLN